MTNLTTRIVISTLLLLVFAGCQPGGEAVGPPFRLGEDAKSKVSDTLASMETPVTLHFYRGGTGEVTGRETQTLLEFMVDTSPEISVLNYSLDHETEGAGLRSSLGVDHGPVVRMEGRGKGTFLFYGFPERKELQPFLDGILAASGKPADLLASVDDFLHNLDQDVQIRIFTTPD